MSIVRHLVLIKNLAFTILAVPGVYINFYSGGGRAGGVGMVSIGLYNLMSFVFDVLSTIRFTEFSAKKNR